MPGTGEGGRPQSVTPHALVEPLSLCIRRGCVYRHLAAMAGSHTWVCLHVPQGLWVPDAPSLHHLLPN